jgi:hypothetical protein
MEHPRGRDTSGGVVILTLVVPDPPPTRASPGRSADRDSPNAEPLVRAAEALLDAEPNRFPLVFSEINVTFGKTMPDVDPLGYQPDHPIYEVLQDLGVAIEPEGGRPGMSRTRRPISTF